MFYKYEPDNSVVSREEMYEIAAHEIDGGDLWNAFMYEIDEHGFEWLWENLSDMARVEISDVAMNNYCDMCFTEMEDEDDVD